MLAFEDSTASLQPAPSSTAHVCCCSRFRRCRRATPGPAAGAMRSIIQRSCRCAYSISPSRMFPPNSLCKFENKFKKKRNTSTSRFSSFEWLNREWPSIHTGVLLFRACSSFAFSQPPRVSCVAFSSCAPASPAAFLVTRNVARRRFQDSRKTLKSIASAEGQQGESTRLVPPHAQSLSLLLSRLVSPLHALQRSLFSPSSQCLCR